MRIKAILDALLQGKATQLKLREYFTGGGKNCMEQAPADEPAHLADYIVSLLSQART
jgi:hypothetical protein